MRNICYHKTFLIIKLWHFCTYDNKVLTNYQPMTKLFPQPSLNKQTAKESFNKERTRYPQDSEVMTINIGTMVPLLKVHVSFSRYRCYKLSQLILVYISKRNNLGIQFRSLYVMFYHFTIRYKILYPTSILI